MSTTYNIRKKLLAIARRDVGKVETSRNRGEWIKKYWPATSFPGGYDERQPYCAASLCHDVREWLKLQAVRDAFLFTKEQAESWRCKSASCYKADDSWEQWAMERGLLLPNPTKAVLHAGDIVIYKHSHIELYVKDVDPSNQTTGDFWAIGANTDSGGGRDGDGKWEKTRSRTGKYGIRNVIRMLP